MTHSLTPNPADKPLVHIGWLLAADVRQAERPAIHREIASELRTLLAEQFPQFRWQVDFLHRHRYAAGGILDPLPPIEFGIQEKTVHRWDYALVIVSNELLARERVHTIGIPSSALETAVLSTASLSGETNTSEFQHQMIMLALHLLGHIWGVEHSKSGPMKPLEMVEDIDHQPLFSPAQQEQIIDRLEEVADQRLEEQSKNWTLSRFYWRAFWEDPKSILLDVIGYRPWRLPFRMGRMTATTAASLLILLLTAEAWEIGVNIPLGRLIIGNLITLMLATILIFTGQNLGQISRDVGWREQLTRTRIVVFGTVLVGMIALWLMLFLFSLAIAWLFPNIVLVRWIQIDQLEWTFVIHQAAFMAMIGLLAGALGGNLEDENAVKANLFFDEET